MLSLLVAAVSLSSPVLSKPAILIYWQPGHVGTYIEMQTEIAVWPNGKVIWRDSPVVWAQRDGKWGLKDAKYYEGKVDRARVTTAIATLRKSGAFKVKGWGYAVPDAHATNMLVRDGKKRLELVCMDEPPTVAPYRHDTQKWAAGLKAWRLVRKLAKELTPAKGVETRRPDVLPWIIPDK